MTEWKLGSTPTLTGVNAGGPPPPPSLSYHQNTFDLLNRRLAVSPKLLRQNGNDDPPVVQGDYRREYGEKTRDVVASPCAATFSEFVFQWAWQRFEDTWVDPVWGHSWPNYVNGLWLRSPRADALPGPF